MINNADHTDCLLCLQTRNAQGPQAKIRVKKMDFQLVQISLELLVIV